MVEQFAHLLAKETRDDGWRCLVGTQAMGIGGRHNAGLQQTVVAIDAHERLYDEGGEAQVLLGGFSWGMQQHTVVGRERPVVVFTATVDACEGLFVKKQAEAVLACNPLHDRHEQHVMVDGQIGLLVDGSELKLVGCHLVVAGLTGDAQLEGYNLQLAHERCHTCGNGTEVMVLHLLVLRGVVTHERAPSEQEVGTCGVEAFVDEEILLFPAEVGGDLLHRWVEVVTDVGSGHVHGMQGTQQRSLIVEGLACVRNENRGDAERVVDDEHRTGGVPRRIAAGLEGAADATRGEARRIGLLLNEQLTRELLHHSALAVVLDERVVLLGGAFGEGLEPVGVVGDSIL